MKTSYFSTTATFKPLTSTYMYKNEEKTMKKFFSTAAEALEYMDHVYEYECRECGTIFWGARHSTTDISSVECPSCGTIGAPVMSFVVPTGRFLRKGASTIEIDNSVWVSPEEEFRDAMSFFDRSILIAMSMLS